MKKTFQLKKIRLKKRSRKITSYDKRGAIFMGLDQVSRVMRSDISLEEGIGIPTQSDLEFSLLTSDESDERPWPLFRYAFETERQAEKALYSLSFVRKAQDTSETVVIRDVRIGMYYHPQQRHWELMVWGAERDALTYMEATLAFRMAGGDVVSRGSLVRSALVGRIETEPEEVELFGLRRKGSSSQFRILESVLTAADLEQFTEAVEQPLELFERMGVQTSRTRMPLEDLFYEPGVRVAKCKLRLGRILRENGDEGGNWTIND